MNNAQRAALATAALAFACAVGGVRGGPAAPSPALATTPTPVPYCIGYVVTVANSGLPAGEAVAQVPTGAPLRDFARVNLPCSSIVNNGATPAPTGAPTATPTPVPTGAPTAPPTNFPGGITASTVTASSASLGALSLAAPLTVVNGGTGSATKNFVDLTTAQTVAGAKFFSSGISIPSLTFGTANGCLSAATGVVTASGVACGVGTVTGVAAGANIVAGVGPTPSVAVTGAPVFPGAVTASQFNGSGAGLSAGTVPISALATPPVTSLVAGSNIVTTAGATPSVAVTAAPVFSTVTTSMLTTAGGNATWFNVNGSTIASGSVAALGIGTAGTDTAYGVLIGSNIGGSLKETDITAEQGVSVAGVPGGLLLVGQPGVGADLALSTSGNLGIAGRLNAASIAVPYAQANCGGTRIVVNCAPYNAVGDGVTNDYEPLQAAITAGAATGSPVYFLPGFTYATQTGLVDPGAPLAVDGGAYAGAGTAPPARILYTGSSTTATVLTVGPGGANTLLQHADMHNIAIDGNNVAATCLAYGGSYAEVEGTVVNNCTQYGLLLANTQAPGYGAIRDHVVTLSCGMPNGGDCVHVGLYAQNLSATQVTLEGLGLTYGGAGRGLVFDYVDESKATNVQAFVYPAPATTLTTAFTTSLTPATIAVASSAKYTANQALLISSASPTQQTYLYVTAVPDATHLTVEGVPNYAVGVGQTYPVGSALHPVGDGVAFLAGAFNDVVDVCTGCFVHAYNQSSFATYPANNTVHNLDYADNHPPLPFVESSARLTYDLDFGPAFNGLGVNGTSCESIVTCNNAAYSLGGQPAHATTSTYVINNANDHQRFDDNNGHVAGFGYGSGTTPQVGSAAAFSLGAPVKAVRGGGSTAGFLSPFLLGSGAAVASTFHCVQDSYTASGTTYTYTFSGDAAFANANYSLSVQDITVGGGVTPTTRAAGSVVLPATNGHVYSLLACGA